MSAFCNLYWNNGYKAVIIHDHKRSENRTFPTEIHTPTEEMFLPKKKTDRIWSRLQTWGRGETDDTQGIWGLHRTPLASSAHNLPEKKEKGEGKPVYRLRDINVQKMCVTLVNNFSLHFRQWGHWMPMRNRGESEMRGAGQFQWANSSPHKWQLISSQSTRIGGRVLRTPWLTLTCTHLSLALTLSALIWSSSPVPGL